MNYEEKYKQTLSFLKDLKPYMSDYCIEKLEGFFPELKESEDEMIRKEIINYLKSFIPHHDYELVRKSKSWIAWLEKQGEQKLIEQDTEIRDLWVYIREWNEKFGRLPKDEDELAACIDYVMKRQKPAVWSEEDEAGLGDALWAIKQASSIVKDENDMGNLWYAENWLKSIKDRVQLQPKQEWSEEDEEKIMWLVRLISTAGYRELDNDKMPCSRLELLDWLKSLKPQSHWKPSEEQLNAFEHFVRNIGESGYASPYDDNTKLLYSLLNDIKKL